VAAADGDLGRRAEVRGPVEFQRMARATNQMLEATSAATRTIASGATALLRRSVEEIMGNVDRSRQAVGTLSTTATELLGVVDRFRH
jgi:methyl-accepting chemotaxis protein